MNNMKKSLVAFSLAALFISIVTSCGSKKEEKDKKFEGYDLAEEKKPSGEELIAQGKLLVEGSDCKTCHHPTNKIVGPAHTDVAKKYEFTQANVSMLADRIIAGGSGVWGDLPMNPHADLSKTDAEKMAMYVLSLDGEKPVD
jgi:cytochrome c